MLKKLRRLKSLSADELRVRSAQKAAAFAERRGWTSATRLPEDAALLSMVDPALWGGHELRSAADLLDHLRGGTRPKFFGGFGEPQETATEFRARWPYLQQGTIEQAERIIEGRFSVLGFDELSFGDPIDWHLEPVSGKRTPLKHWSRLNYLDAELAGDKKIIWELNRHQYFATLGQAYWLTGDERYAETFLAHLDSWMDHNPPKLGINWASSLEIALRSISWLWAFYFFKNSPILNPRVFMRALKFLYLNARHLETYLSTYFSPNTHLTGEALGLFYLGVLLPEFKDARRWRETGRRVLLEQLPIHVRPDGVYFEQSTYYHRYTVDFYSHFLILSRANGEILPAEVEEKLQALLDHLMYITRPDGTTPFLGDDDGGRLVMLDRRPANDFRAALSTGAVLFKRSDYKFVAGDTAQETLWLLGASGLRELDGLIASEPARQSVAFESGGLYVMRDDWSDKANYLLFDCGPHGQANCGHAHADALSFELVANGRTLLVDPGTYTYTGSVELRNWFRSSCGHNTLTIDGRSSSIPAGPFSWQSIARCQPQGWLSRNRFDYVKGSQNGYENTAEAASHTRSILFLKHNYWVMRDQVRSAGAHTADLWFHFDSVATPLVESSNGQDSFIQEVSGETGLDIHAFSVNGRWRREEGWISNCYANKRSSHVYVFSTRITGDSVVTFMLPRMAGLWRQVKEIEAVGGRAFEVANGNWLDIVMIRTGERVETAGMTSDFEWTWARFSQSDQSILEELVLIGGRTLQLQGSQILQADQDMKYVAARRVDDQFQVDTDKGAFGCEFPIADFEATLRG